MLFFGITLVVSALSRHTPLVLHNEQVSNKRHHSPPEEAYIVGIVKLCQFLFSRFSRRVHGHLVLQTIAEDELICKFEPLRPHRVSFAIMIVPDSLRMVVGYSGRRVGLSVRLVVVVCAWAHVQASAHLYYGSFLLWNGDIPAVVEERTVGKGRVIQGDCHVAQCLCSLIDRPCMFSSG